MLKSTYFVLSTVVFGVLIGRIKGRPQGDCQGSECDDGPGILPVFPENEVIDGFYYFTPSLSKHTVDLKPKKSKASDTPTVKSNDDKNGRSMDGGVVYAAFMRTKAASGGGGATPS